jgi:hypothetical protein
MLNVKKAKEYFIFADQFAKMLSCGGGWFILHLSLVNL